MWNRIFAIIRKEFFQTLRDPRSRALLIGPPLLQLILFGYAVNLDVENARTAWLDMDRTPESRELLSEFQGSRYFRISAFPATDREIQDLMDHAEVQAVIRVLPGYSRDVKRGNSASVQILVDGTNSNTASIVASYATQIVVAHASRTLSEQQNSRLVGPTAKTGGPAPAVIPVLIAQSRVWFNSGLVSRVYFVPGVIVNIIALVTIMLTAMSIVREKEIGTMEQLMVTPVRPIEVIVGKLLPFAVVGVFQVALVIFAARMIFNVPIRGNIALIFGCGLLFLLSTLGVGLFISTISHTQQQAMMSSFFFFMPAMLLSGFAFPIRNMPAVVQYLTFLNPLRYFMQIVRDLFLKGVGIASIWHEVLALFVFGLLILSLSALRFHKKLD
ncbi:MAG TPA: ABC transporter permease [Acidobacteriota bacterium]|nr:ABC transporter permease [Acidobacteriota bacterium]